MDWSGGSQEHAQGAAPVPLNAPVVFTNGRQGAHGGDMTPAELPALSSVQTWAPGNAAARLARSQTWQDETFTKPEFASSPHLDGILSQPHGPGRNTYDASLGSSCGSIDMLYPPTCGNGGYVQSRMQAPMPSHGSPLYGAWVHGGSSPAAFASGHLASGAGGLLGIGPNQMPQMQMPEMPSPYGCPVDAGASGCVATHAALYRHRGVAAPVLHGLAAPRGAAAPVPMANPPAHQGPQIAVEDQGLPMPFPTGPGNTTSSPILQVPPVRSAGGAMR